MSKPRRLIVTDTNGSQLKTDDHYEPLQHYQIDLTGIANANSTMPWCATIQEQCNLGCWHDLPYGVVKLPIWGTA
jgi:hypothetical protein